VTTLDPKVWDLLEPEVQKIARGISWGKFKAYVEYDDIYQTAWLYYLEHRKSCDELLETDEGLRLLRKRMSSACHHYALKEMCAKTGVVYEDQYRYSAREVRNLLKIFFEGGLQGGEPEALIAGYVDLYRGLLRTPGADILELKASYGPESDAQDARDSTARGRSHRAVQRLQRAMNGDPE